MRLFTHLRHLVRNVRDPLEDIDYRIVYRCVMDGLPWIVLGVLILAGLYFVLAGLYVAVEYWLTRP